METWFFNPFFFSTYPFPGGMSRELRPAPSTLSLDAIDNLNERMCRLRINATLNVVDMLGHSVPRDIAREVTPSRVFQEEELLVTAEGGGLADACKALVSATRGSAAPPSDEDNTNPSEVTQNFVRQPEAQYSDMETEEG
jgi:hypothetical protein